MTKTPWERAKQRLCRLLDIVSIDSQDELSSVDISDEMCSIYDVSQIWNRWSLRIFYHPLNTTGNKASIVYQSVLPEKKMRCSRLLEIRMDLVQPQWNMRSIS
ncbi:UNVERIFIED_CONTAM: hypothetical protein NCL1_60253 [Trichonephila clavipes]